MKPFFSIVIPTFNRSLVLKRAIESVLAQSFLNYEILVMDDGSTDDTQDIVESFQDQRIFYNWAENSGGPATPRNRGIDSSRADWICFLDADDLWYPDKLESVAEEIIRNPDSDLFCHNMMLSDKRKKRKSPLRYGPFKKDFYRVMLIWGNRLSTSATTVRRDYLNRNKLRFNQSSDYVIVEDYDMWLRCAFYSAKFHFINEIHGEYLLENNNISSDHEKLRYNYSVLLKDHINSLQVNHKYKDQLWRKVQSRILLGDCKNSVLKKKYFLAIHYLFSSFMSSPIVFIIYTYLRIYKRISDPLKKILSA